VGVKRPGGLGNEETHGQHQEVWFGSPLKLERRGLELTNTGNRQGCRGLQNQTVPGGNKKEGRTKTHGREKKTQRNTHKTGGQKGGVMWRERPTLKSNARI